MKEKLYISGWCKITDQTVILNNKKENPEENFANFAAFIKNLYKKEQVSYPKFYKMDNLSKLGFLTAELLIKNSDVLKKYEQKEIGVVIANSSSSLDTDFDYQELIKDKSNYFPSPSVFVYTLPNILIGEICIRHQIKGENAFFVSEEFDPEQIINYVTHLFEQGKTEACICGWVELLRDKYHSSLFLVERMDDIKLVSDADDGIDNFNKDNICKFFHK
jgi:3-oxoacyl-(acyl-carrier-protein) synthase